MTAAVRAAALAVVAPVALLGGLGACGGKPRPEEAARPPVPGDAAPADAAAGDAAAPAPSARGATGDLQVRVEWPGVPVAARGSPGRTPCGTRRTPSVAPTTTWGIPDALVVVEGAPRTAGPPPTARLTLADCTLTPRLAIGDTLAITSAVDRPARLVLRKRGPLDHLAAGDPVPVQLPIAGHTVTTALDAGAIYSLETDAPEPEVAFVAALPGQVTDATGHAVIRDLSAGAHAVTTWLPPRAGQPARLGRGTATVAAGELTELTITLAP
jgi:hypothetical protein